jgi:hypothetical protein
MITDRDRKLLALMLALKMVEGVENMRLVDFRSVAAGTAEVLKGIKERQARDVRKHAPCCPANHYHYTRIVYQHCTCGAAQWWHRDGTPVKPGCTCRHDREFVADDCPHHGPNRTELIKQVAESWL